MRDKKVGEERENLASDDEEFCCGYLTRATELPTPPGRVYCTF